MVVVAGPGDAEPLLELVGGQEETVARAGDGDVDRRGDAARRFQLRGLPHVHHDRVRVRRRSRHHLLQFCKRVLFRCRRACVWALPPDQGRAEMSSRLAQSRHGLVVMVEQDGEERDQRDNSGVAVQPCCRRRRGEGAGAVQGPCQRTESSLARHLDAAGQQCPVALVQIRSVGEMRDLGVVRGVRYVSM